MRAAASPGSVTCWVGKWGITMDDLLFYDAESSTGAFYTTNILGEIALLKEHTNWRQSWTHILPGNFGGDGHTDLLFYDPTAGEGEFWTTDGRGGIRLLRKQTGWRTTWTKIIPGAFGGSAGITDLLFYEAATGTGQFYATEQGHITELQTHTNWRNSWTHIVPGAFGGSNFTDLFFYEAASGTGEFYVTDGHGGIVQLRLHSGLRTTWTHIIPGSFSGSAYTDLLFYDAINGVGEFWTTDGQGGLSFLSGHVGFSSADAQIFAGNFGGNSYSDLVFYDPATGRGSISTTNGSGVVQLLKQHTDWRRSWRIIVPGDFGGDARTFVAAPTNLTVTGVADRRVNLSWTHSGQGISSFFVRFRGTRSGEADHSGNKTVSQSERTASITGLRSGFAYTFTVTARNLVAESPKSNEAKATTPARTLVVTKEGAGLSAVFITKGANFTPNSLVVQKITASNLGQVQFPETARADGTFESRHAVACTSGQMLTFTAFEDDDPQGTFAIPVVTTCP